MPLIELKSASAESLFSSHANISEGLEANAWKDFLPGYTRVCTQGRSSWRCFIASRSPKSNRAGLCRFIVRMVEFASNKGGRPLNVLQLVDVSPEGSMSLTNAMELVLFELWKEEYTNIGETIVYRDSVGAWCACEVVQHKKKTFEVTSFMGDRDDVRIAFADATEKWLLSAGSDTLHAYIPSAKPIGDQPDEASKYRAEIFQEWYGAHALSRRFVNNALPFIQESMPDLWKDRKAMQRMLSASETLVHKGADQLCMEMLEGLAVLYMWATQPKEEGRDHRFPNNGFADEWTRVIMLTQAEGFSIRGAGERQVVRLFDFVSMKPKGYPAPYVLWAAHLLTELNVPRAMQTIANLNARNGVSCIPAGDKEYLKRSFELINGGEGQDLHEEYQVAVRRNPLRRSENAGRIIPAELSRF